MSHMLNKCRHCDKEIRAYKSDGISINEQLCIDCWLLWCEFHEKNYSDFHKNHKSTWEFFKKYKSKRVFVFR